MRKSRSTVLAVLVLACAFPTFPETVSVVFEEGPPYERTAGSEVVETAALVMKEVGKRL